MWYQSSRGSTKVFVPVFLGVIAVLLFFFYRSDRFIPSLDSAQSLYPSGSGSLATNEDARGVSLSSRGQGGSLGYAIGGDPVDSAGPRGITIGQADPAVSQYGSELSIFYTDDGFSSAEITLPPGTRTVRFLNKSKGLFWPAAAGEWHPPLDAGYGLSPGSSYVYQFPDRQGNFGVANRLRSEHRLIIRIP